MSKRQVGARTVWPKCLNCRERFVAKVVERRRGNALFCSRSCAAEYGNRHRLKKGRTRLSFAEKKARYGDTILVNYLVCRIRARAKKAQVPCSIDGEMFREIWHEQKGRCYYTGRKMRFGTNTRKVMHMDSATVDRVVPSRGYVRNNIVLCCRWVNSAKGQGTLKQLKVRARELLNH